MVVWGPSRGLLSWGGQEAGINEAQEDFETDMFFSLILVMVSWPYTYVKIYQIVHLSVCCLLYFNFNFIKLFIKKNSVSFQSLNFLFFSEIFKIKTEYKSNDLVYNRIWFSLVKW